MSFCGGWGGLHSNCPLQPNYCVEVVLRLCCAVVEVVTTKVEIFKSHPVVTKVLPGHQ